MIVTTRYLKRPLHFFGAMGLWGLLIGGAIPRTLPPFGYSGMDRWATGRFCSRVRSSCPSLGVQLFSLGVLAELMIKLSHKSQALPAREMVGFEDTQPPQEPH